MGEDMTDDTAALIERLTRERDEARAALAEARKAMKALYRGYVNTLEHGRDAILRYGGDCDPVDVMERGDPHLREASAAIAAIDAAIARQALDEIAQMDQDIARAKPC